MESIIGSIQGLKGSTDDVVYDLFFTEKRLIAAIVLHFTDFKSIRQRSGLLQVFFGNISERREIKSLSLKLINERRLAFNGKTIDEIRLSHKANVEIHYGDIISTNIKRTFLGTFLELTVQRNGLRKIRFRLEKSRADEVEDLVERALPGRVK